MSRSRPSIQACSGFTLAEMLLVLVLIGVVLALTLPRFGHGNDRVIASRSLIGLIQELHVTASSTKQPYKLYLDLDRQAYWAKVITLEGEQTPAEPSLARLWTLPSTVRVRDTSTPAQGTVRSGLAVLVFRPIGRADPSVIHLTDDSEDVMTLVLNPLTGGVKVLDRDVEMQDRRGVPDAIRDVLLRT